MASGAAEACVAAIDSDIIAATVRYRTRSAVFQIVKYITNNPHAAAAYPAANSRKLTGGYGTQQVPTGH